MKITSQSNPSYQLNESGHMEEIILHLLPHPMTKWIYMMITSGEERKHGINHSKQKENEKVYKLTQMIFKLNLLMKEFH